MRVADFRGLRERRLLLHSRRSLRRRARVRLRVRGEGIQFLLSGKTVHELKVRCDQNVVFSFLVQGIWSGMIGGTFMQTFILLWVTFRTNWSNEVIFSS